MPPSVPGNDDGAGCELEADGPQPGAAELASDGLPPDAAPALEPRRPAVRMYTTPEVLRSLCPSLGSIYLDIPGCRVRSKFDGEQLPSVCFGPMSGSNRKEAVEKALDNLWSHSEQRRPATSHVDSVPWDVWGGVLDTREEHPRKYSCRK